MEDIKKRVNRANPAKIVRDVSRMRKEMLLKDQHIEDLKKELKIANETLKDIWVPPNHFYSPLVTKTDFEHFDTRPTVPGIDINTVQQLKNLKEISKYYKEQPFTEKKNPKNRYYFGNDQFRHSDALVLYGMLRKLKPKRVIEVGSGYSSALMLDVNNKFFDNTIDLTFIEPYPTRLNSLLRSQDKNAAKIIKKQVQKVPLVVFDELEQGDILFIDSSHVSKTGSDVNWLYFEILPRLKPGVTVHIHDIPYPFEYYDLWIKQGRSWNEAYLLRALLIDNPKFEIVFWGHFLHTFHGKLIRQTLPLSKKDYGGSIWIQRK